MQLKILLTVHQFLPDYFSGTEILTFSVARELIRRGHRVSVFTGYPAKQDFADGARFDEYKIDDLDVYRFHHAYVPMDGQNVVTELEYNNRLSARYFAKLLQRIKPDVVHFFHFTRLGAGLIDATAAARIPAYYTPTDFWSVCPTCQLLLDGGRICGGPTRYGGNCVKHIGSLTRGERFARFAKLVPDAVADALVKLTIDGVLPKYTHSDDVAAAGQRKRFNVTRLNALHGIVSPTRLMTKVLVANGVDERSITQSGYGIDLTWYSHETRKTRANGPVTIGFIGTLAPHKGCAVLIDAFRQLALGSARLRIYGNLRDFPDYVDDLKRRAIGNDAIEFCGTFRNDKIADIFSGLDALVVPSVWYENTPLVILSAMAAKCPVVASDFPGMSEVVRHGQNGLIFPPGDVQGLAAQLTRLVDDPSLIDRLSANCVRPKSVAEYVDGLLALYKKSDAVPGRSEIPGQQTIIPLE